MARDRWRNSSSMKVDNECAEKKRQTLPRAPDGDDGEAKFLCSHEAVRPGGTHLVFFPGEVRRTGAKLRPYASAG